MAKAAPTAISSETKLPKYAYEAVIILKPDSTEEAQKQILRKNKEIIEAHSGSVFSVETWGRRQLGNPIGKARKGIYFHVTFQADNKAVAELERVMKINETVLRVMHTRLPEGTVLSEFMEKFKQALSDTIQKERDRETKIQLKRAQASSGRSHFAN